MPAIRSPLLGRSVSVAWCRIAAGVEKYRNVLLTARFPRVQANSLLDSLKDVAGAKRHQCAPRGCFRRFAAFRRSRRFAICKPMSISCRAASESPRIPLASAHWRISSCLDSESRILNIGSCPVAGRPIRFSVDFIDFAGISSTFCRTLMLTKCFTFSSLEKKLQDE